MNTNKLLLYRDMIESYYKYSAQLQRPVTAIQEKVIETETEDIRKIITEIIRLYKIELDKISKEFN